MALIPAIVRLALWIAAFWACLFVASVFLWPLESPRQPISFTGNPHALFVDSTQETVYELARKCPLPARKRMVVIGGSGAIAFHPDLLRDVTAADDVVTLALNFSNYAQLRQVVTDLRDCLDEPAMRQTTFVVVTTAFSFVATQTRFANPYTGYETEKLRSRLFSGSPGAVEPVVGRRLTPIAVNLWRPVLLVRKLRLDLDKKLHALLHHSSRPRQPAVEGADWVNNQQLREMAVRMLPTAPEGGTFAPEQTGQLESLIAEVRSSGGTVVVVEQPTQGWLRKDAPAHEVAHAHLQQLLKEQAVPFIDLSESAKEDEFKNPVHANARGEVIWSQRLAHALAEIQQRDPSALGPITRAGTPGGSGSHAPAVQ